MGVETIAEMGEDINMNIPNVLTLLRISLIPILVVIYYLPFSWSYLAAAIIFGLAAITDWLDGFLARKLKQVSSFGAFLDPVADKLIIAVALVLLVQGYHTVFLAIPAAVIIGREIVISALREWMAELGKRHTLAVSAMGKFKTAAQMVAILLLLSQNPHDNSWITILGYILIYVAAFFTLWSMTLYLLAARDELLKKNVALTPF